jgi:hypothetical protein
MRLVSGARRRPLKEGQAVHQKATVVKFGGRF